MCGVMYLFPKPLSLVLLFVVLTCSSSVSAVQYRMSDLDQSLVFPYHIEQGLFDTHFVVENQSADIKVLKVNVWGNEGGQLVSSFHLFIPAYYQWTAALSELNENLVLHTKDPACTVPTGHFIDSQGLDINLISVQLIDGEKPMRLARSGNIEIIEIGLLKQQAISAQQSQQPSNISTSCAGLNMTRESSHDSNLWIRKLTASLLPPSGGLAGQAEIRDLWQGDSAHYQAVAMNYIYRPEKSSRFLSEKITQAVESRFTYFLGNSVLASNVSD